jgi:hypothetical protein
MDLIYQRGLRDLERSKMAKEVFFILFLWLLLYTVLPILSFFALNWKLPSATRGNSRHR